MAEQSFTVPVPEDFDPDDRAEFIDAIIDYIVDRTTDGKSIHGGKFRMYSAAYAEAKGVGRSEVDLMDTGAMLDSMRVLRQNGSELTIGYRDGSKLAKRAEYNQEGRTPRPFLGLNKRELRELENFVREGQ